MHANNGIPPLKFINFSFQRDESGEKIVDEILKMAVSLVSPHKEHGFDSEIPVDKRLEDHTRM